MIGIVTVSDSRGPEEDRSGPALREALAALGYQDIHATHVRDEFSEIERLLRELAENCEAVFTTGGTGFGLRDVTPEATASVLDRRADSLVELLRLRGLEHTPLSHLSRGVAGVSGRCLIVNLPGSPKAAKQGIEALAPLLPRILSELRGEGCEHLLAVAAEEELPK